MAVQEKALLLRPAQSITDIESLPGFTMPVDDVNYEIATERRLASLARGARVPGGLRHSTRELYRITASGPLLYEIMPYFFSNSFSHMQKGDAVDGLVEWPDPATPGSIGYQWAPYPDAEFENTALTYYNAWIYSEDLQSASDMLQFYGGFCSEFSFSGNAQGDQIGYSMTMLAPSENTSGVADVTPAAYTLTKLGGDPAPIHPLDLFIATKDAAAGGSSFSGLTTISCNLLDWTMAFTAPRAPRYTANGGSGIRGFCSTKRIMPSATFAATFVTNADTYAAIHQRHVNDTPLELRITMGPDSDARRATFYLTGHWTQASNILDESDDEVVINAVFTAETPSVQTSNHHWGSWKFKGKFDYDFGDGTIS